MSRETFDISDVCGTVALPHSPAMAVASKSDIYDDLMRLKPEGLTPNGWATKAGVSRTVWADMRRHGNPSRRTLEKLLTAAGSSLAEFEALRIGVVSTVPGRPAGALADRRPSAWGAPHLPPLSLVATALAGEWGQEGSSVELIEIRTGEMVGRLPRPVSLADDHSAYAITVVGDSMWPRFRPGRQVAVSAQVPVALGDDVLVKLRSGAGSGAAVGSTTPAMIKELVGKSATAVELRQFNPDLTFEVPTSAIAAIERVVGELI